jgi:hypothetical protein
LLLTRRLSLCPIRAAQEEKMVSNREAAEKYTSVEEAEEDFM